MQGTTETGLTVKKRAASQGKFHHHVLPGQIYSLLSAGSMGSGFETILKYKDVTILPLLSPSSFFRLHSENTLFNLQCLVPRP